MGDEKNDVKYSSVPVDEQTLNKKNAEETNEKGSNTFLYVSACAANLSAFICGLAIGWTSPAIPKLNGTLEPKNNPLVTPLSLDQESWVGSLLPIGAALGPFAAGLFIDKIGRKKTLVVATLPFVAAYIMAVFLTNVNLLFLMRFLCGLGCGGVFTVLPVYVAEIAESSVRGTLGASLGLFVTGGVLCSYVIGPYVSIAVFNVVSSIAPTLFVPIFLMYIPDSPYFLVRTSCEEAEKALMKFRGRSRDGVQKELLEIRETVEASARCKTTFADVFRGKSFKRAFILANSLMAFQQLSGINVIVFYTQNIFEAIGSTIPPHVCVIILGVIQVLSNCVAPILVDKTGKKILLMFSSATMFVFLFLLGVYFHLQTVLDDVNFLSWLPILSLMCYTVAYNVGFGPLPWALMGELFSSNAKSVSSTMTASWSWILAFAITKSFGALTELIGTAGSFWIFAGFCAFAFLFVVKLVPETSGKSLQEIQDILNRD